LQGTAQRLALAAAGLGRDNSERRKKPKGQTRFGRGAYPPSAARCVGTLFAMERLKLLALPIELQRLTLALLTPHELHSFHWQGHNLAPM